MDSPTVEDARIRKRELERTIMDSIKEYEKNNDVTVESVRLRRTDMNDGSSHLTNVEVEVEI